MTQDLTIRTLKQAVSLSRLNLSFKTTTMVGRDFVITHYAKLLTGEKTKLIKLQDYSMLRQPGLDLRRVFNIITCSPGTRNDVHL